MFEERFYKDVDCIVKKYPQKIHALLPILHLVQKELGFISKESMQEVAKLCEVHVSHIQGVVTFYTMFAQEQRGKCLLSVCTNISCMLRGAQDILKHLEQKLGIHAGQSTADGQFFLEETECLGACGSAPVMIVGEDYQEQLTPAKINQILDPKS